MVDERFRNFNTLAAKLIKTMTNININLDETKENTDMCQAMQEIIEDVRNEYIEENNKLRAEANEAKAEANEAKAQIIFLKERIAQLEKAVKNQD